MVPFLNRGIGRAASGLARFAAMVLAGIMALTFLDVVGRTFFGRALVGTVESVELMMGILVFCGLAITEINRRHIVVETFQNLFPGPARRLSEIVNSGLAVAVTGLLAWRLLVKTGEIIDEQEYTQIWELPFWPTAIVMCVGICLFLLALVARLIEDLRGSADRARN
ncbi:MAG: TRAP transporter small permease [Defluviicoccus sp.]|nr:TRAP transporter small permease [Defluviicoccus sp.]